MTARSALLILAAAALACAGSLAPKVGNPPTAADFGTIQDGPPSTPAQLLGAGPTIWGPATPTLVQSLGDHGAMTCANQICTWTLSRAIRPGATVVGFVHGANENDTNPIYPQSIRDNAGNTYMLTAPVEWVPFHEDIGFFYLTNVQGNPNTFTFDFSQYTSAVTFEDVGLSEYAGVKSITVVAPVLATGANPTLTISPTSPALIWAFASPFGGSPGSLLNQGYSIIINDFPTDDMGVWDSNLMVPEGALTLNWNAPTGTQNPCDGTSNQNRCPTVIGAIALQGGGGG
jgi:hypothetical protein